MPPTHIISSVKLACGARSTAVTGPAAFGGGISRFSVFAWPFVADPLIAGDASR